MLKSSTSIFHMLVVTGLTRKANTELEQKMKSCSVKSDINREVHSVQIHPFWTHSKQ